MQLEGQIQPLGPSECSVGRAWPLALLKGLTLITPTNSFTQQDLGVFLWCFLFFPIWNVGLWLPRKIMRQRSQCQLSI